ncbi:phosphoribosylglycinamide formyltransferase [Alteribacter populi]|uniref:phosphoribosylglycinamide formyltransferase n=1 Tax=Alteribacter populi TaxID=2011011 RepID=UPI000BBB4C76|nr:phosphoribosylglycinamide formyltransferase [Alteribacter populi]
MKIAVFASGSGSNFQAILEAQKEETLQAEVALLVCDKPGAKVIDRAVAHNIPIFVFDPHNYNMKAEFEQEVITKLAEHDCSYVILAGYMRLIGKTLLQPFEGRIINIHPSLLPAFPGLDAIGQAFDAGVKVTGVTVHFVDQGVDTGPIIAQQAVTIEDGDTRADMQRKVQEVEHALYPKTIQSIITKKMKEVSIHE